LPDTALTVYGRQPQVPVNDRWLLRPWRKEDAPMVVAAFADPDIQRWNMHRMDSEEEALEWIDRWADCWADGSDVGFAVARVDNDVAAGFVALRQIRLQHARAEISGWGIPAARGMGMGARAIQALARWAFDELGLQRLFLLHSTANPASCRMAVNGGFRAEGTLRNFLLHADGWHDMHMHARLSGDTDKPPLSG
jgi:[ribosomal protein S5]-alanine N-acetyltransferase